MPGMPAVSHVALFGTVSGRVQAVAFRWFTARAAARIGVTGWVRNLRDGRVELLVQGSPDAVAAMRDFLTGGPPAAHVESIDLQPVDIDPALRRFEIR